LMYATTAPDPSCTVSQCAPNDTNYICSFGAGPYLIDTGRCETDIDAQILTTCSSCSTGLPSPVNLFGLYVAQGNLQVGAFCTDIQGRLAVSGNATWCQAIGDQIAGPNTNNIPCLTLIDYLCDFPWAMVIGETANISGAVYGGDVWARTYATYNPNLAADKTKLIGEKAKGSLLGSHLNKVDNLEAVNYQCLTFGPPTTPVPIDFGAIWELLKDYTLDLDLQPRTGDVSTQGPVIKFRGTNTPDTEIFQLGCQAIGPDTHNIEIENINPNVKAIIINVFCYPDFLTWNLSATNGFDMGALEPYQSRILWNVDTDNVVLSNIGFRGSLLAPYAAVVANNGNFVGSVVVRDYQGTFQINLPIFEGCPSLILPSKAAEMASPYRKPHPAPKK